MSNEKDLKAPSKLTATITSRSPVPSLSQVDIQPYFVQAAFTSPDGNFPAPNNNMVFVWDGGPNISATTAAGQGTVLGTLKDGTASASPTGGQNFFSSDYVMGYSVGPSGLGPDKKTVTYPNIAASIYIPGGVGSTQPTQAFGSSIDLVLSQVMATSLVFVYGFPPGTNPPVNGAFIGLWNQNLTSPYQTAPQVTVPLQAPNQWTGQVFMPGLRLSSGMQYTAALYTSGYPLTAGATAPTTIAAWITFQVVNAL